MKILDFIILLLLFVLLFAGTYLLWFNFPSESIEFEEYVSNTQLDLPSSSSQFYSNMRYQEKEITYSVAQNCSAKKKLGVDRAAKRLSDQTILNLKKTSSGLIDVSCSRVSPKPEQEDFFVAGEGGPTEILNASRFSVILSGKISLFRPDKCDAPQIATHELLHALGFDHNSNEESIMFPVTNCDQTLDQSLIDEIERLYTVPSRGDLVLESVTANKSGRYLDFEVTVSNYGLKDIKNASISLLADGSFIKKFELENIDLGARKRLGISNLRISRKVQTITIIAETSEPEISRDNNRAEISSLPES